MTRHEQKEEAIVRLNELVELIHLDKAMVDSLKNNGNVNISCIYPEYMERLDEIIEKIKYLVDKYNIYVYHIIVGPLFVNFLYVSDAEDEKELDRPSADYENGRCIIMAYVMNMEDDECSEFGRIEIMGSNGGIIRTN